MASGCSAFVLSGRCAVQLVFSAERLCQECDARGLTADELARRARCSSSAVYKWRRGAARPGVNELAAIALAMGVPLESFYTAVPAPADADTSQTGAA